MVMTDFLKENVLCVIKNIETGNVRYVKGHNIVTNAGDIHYAKKIMGENSELDYLYLRLGTGTANPTKDDIDVNTYIDGSAKVVDLGFPQRNYTDEGNANGGENVITYKITYDVGQIVASGISEGALTNSLNSPTLALNHFLFDEVFDLTAQDQLIVFINHAFVGV